MLGDTAAHVTVQLQRRLLVFTDVGEEVDDEGALWMMSRVLESAPTWEADVVFTTGRPMERAARWAGILDSVEGPKPGAGRIRYLIGPDTDRALRYPQKIDTDLLARSGVAPLTAFTGGSYDVVLQLSPLGGFAAPQEDPCGPLARVVLREGAKAALYIVVGREGSTNFPIGEPVHRNFQLALAAKGFTTVHVEAANYAAWCGDDLVLLPRGLAELVADDEWNKAVGRIAPHAADLFVRFRVTTQVNYDVISSAFAVFQSRHAGEAAFEQASAWWSELAGRAQELIAERYITASRENDDAGAQYGNPTLREPVRGQDTAWESIISQGCKSDLVSNFGPEIQMTAGSESGTPDLSVCRVDTVMGWAVLLTTERIARMYAFAVLRAGAAPDQAAFEEYLAGPPPLGFRRFPSFPPAVAPCAALIKAEVIRNPQYDPSGMLVALAAMQADAEQASQLADRLRACEPLLPPDGRAEAVRAAYRGEAPEQLLARFFPPLSHGP